MTEPSVRELLAAYGQADDALLQRGVARSKNIVGDYAEHLFQRAFGWELAPKSTKSFDLQSKTATYQVKARRVSPTNRSCELGAMPVDDALAFDALAAVIFEADFEILYAAIIPREVLMPLRTSRDSNRPRFVFRQACLEIPGVQVVTEHVRSAQRDWT